MEGSISLFSVRRHSPKRQRSRPDATKGATTAGSAFLERPTRALLQKNFVSSGSTSSSTNGSSMSESFVSSRVRRNAKNALASAIAEAITNVEGGAESTAEADASAEAVATAYIKIVLNGRAVSTVTGDGEACGEFFASAESAATIVAEATAEAFAQSENALIIAQGEATAEAVKKATLTVEAEIRGEACTTGGEAEAVQTLVAEQELKAIAKAFATAFAIVFGEDGDAGTTSGANSQANNSGQLSSEEMSTVDGVGSASTGASAQVFVCDNNARKCCDQSNVSNNICNCGSQCTGRFNEEKGYFAISNNGARFKCRC